MIGPTSSILVSDLVGIIEQGPMNQIDSSNVIGGPSRECVIVDFVGISICFLGWITRVSCHSVQWDR